MSQSSRRDRLPPNQQWVAPQRWPLVGETAALDDGEPWTLSIEGCVKQAKRYSLAMLAELPQSACTIDIHCVTRWSKQSVSFQGVLLKDLLDQVELADDARYISFVAKTARRHCSSLPLSEALDLGTLLATEALGKPLEPEHGGPLRGVVPGKYFYKSVKWVERIELLAEDRLGHWEADAGYHNEADPWKEQRYLATSLDKRTAARLAETKDFSGQNLLSLNVARRDLRGLRAQEALLRNANFSHCLLEKANFQRANLSNANFRFANLRDAHMEGADLEGVDFSGADLRGVRFSGCSLFGASFCEIDGDGVVREPAIFDDRQRLSESQRAALTAEQRNFVDSAMH